MAISQEQKVDFLLKKIGFTASKTGNATDATGLSGTLTPKAGFAEAIPSPLIIANTALWNESASIPATPPGSDTTQVKVYAPAGALRMTVDSTVANNRAFIAYTTYNDTSSARLTNWIDTQFGPDYIIQVFYDDATDSAKKLNAGGSGNNDGWFFDYSAGVLNFNDTNVPNPVTSTNVYIVGYRYVGQTGAPTSGISTFSYLDLTVERNLDVGVQGGISTFRNNIDLNADLDVDGHTNLDNVSISGVTTGTIINATTFVGNGDFVELDVDGHTELDNVNISGLTTAALLNVSNLTNGRVTYAGAAGRLVDSANLTFNGSNLTVGGNVNAVDGVFSGNVSIGGTLTYEDVTNVDSVGLLTARSGIRVTGGVIEAQAGQNKIPSLYSTFSDLPSAGSYHGMFAHVHNQGRGYFAHAGNWMELVNKELNGVVGTGTERYNVGPIDAVDINVSSSSTTKSFNVTGVSTFGGNLDINADIDVDGHTNLDNVSIAGVTTLGNIIEGVAGQNKIPSLYTALTDLPSAGTYHGMFAHVHVTGRGYFAHAGNWLELVNKETNGTVGTGTETYNIGSLTATGIDLNGDIDVDGHTNLDNVSIAGVTTTSGLLDINAGGQANTFKVEDLTDNRIVIAGTGGELEDSANLTFDGSTLALTGSQTISGDIDVDGHTNLDNVSIAGVTTATGKIDANGDVDVAGTLDVDGHTELDNVNIIGVTTHQGHVLPSADVTYDLGSSSKQWRNLFADNIVSAPGNGFIGPDLTVRNLKATGLSTFVGQSEFDGNVKFDSTITAGGGTGSNGQYLKTVGTGVTWASFPTLRTRQTFTASAGQTTFSIAYTVNFLDVYVNGIKLTDSEFTATNGTQVVLAVGCFVGDIVELVAFNSVSTGTGGGGSLNNIVEDLTPQLGGNLDLFNKTIEGTGSANISGVVTATAFVGDGSGLTGIVASGTGIIIKDSGSTVGTAGTINFADNLSVSPASAGIVTISAPSNFSNITVSGIATFSGYVNTGTGATVGIGSTAYVHKIAFAEAGSTNSTLTAALGNNGGALTFTGSGVQNGFWSNSGLRIGGNGASALTGPEANCSLHVVSSENTRVLIHGAATAQMELRSTVGNGVENIFKSNKALDFITGTGAYSNVFRVGETEGSTFFHTLNFRASDASNKTVTIDAISGIGTFKGIVVNGATSTISNLNITGVITATTFKGALQATSGTFSSGVEFASDIDVDGHTNLDNVNIAGVTSVGNLTSGRVVTVGTGGKLQDSSNLTFDGTSLFVSGINVTDPGTGTTVSIGADIVTNNIKATGISTFQDVDINGDLDVDGHTNLDNVTIAGVATFSSVVNANEFSGAASANNLTSGTVPSGRLSGSYNITNTGSAANIVVANENADAENFIVFTNAATGSQAPKTGSNLKFNASNGRLTATSFIGDGSGLTGVTAEGTGIVIKNRDNTVGTAGTINFDDTLNVSAISAGITTVGVNTSQLNVNKLNVIGISTFQNDISIDRTIKHLGDTTTSINFPTNLNISFVTNNQNRLQIGPLGQFGINGATNYGTDGQVLTSKGSGSAVQWTTVASSVGITTNVGGSFSATAGTPSTIDTFTNYSSDDKVIEYTIYVKQGSNFQAQKLLALVDGSTIHTTQFAVVFDSSLLVQCDAIISGGNILLRVTPETGVNGSANYRVKREVM